VSLAVVLLVDRRINEISFNTRRKKSSKKTTVANESCIPLEKSRNVAVLEVILNDAQYTREEG
jgi:hypothetical protein